MGLMSHHPAEGRWLDCPGPLPEASAKAKGLGVAVGHSRTVNSPRSQLRRALPSGPGPALLLEEGRSSALLGSLFWAPRVGPMGRVGS